MVTQGLISTREDILERAIPLFARLGFHGVSMRDIAAEVEMQAAALYHHFADKEALYLAAMAYAFKDKSVVLTQAIADFLPRCRVGAGQALAGTPFCGARQATVLRK